MTFTWILTRVELPIPGQEVLVWWPASYRSHMETKVHTAQFIQYRPGLTREKFYFEIDGEWNVNVDAITFWAAMPNPPEEK